LFALARQSLDPLFSLSRSSALETILASNVKK
jgi:hypothetical protein